MSKRALILVEGPTEERFVKMVLAPAFFALDLYIVPTILNTRVVKDGRNFKGGVTKYVKFKGDAQRLIRGAGDALVTMLLDYYGLPDDFPGMPTRPPGSPLARVAHIEQAIAADLGSDPRFLPFLALHEFEAWLFSSPDELPRVLTTAENAAEFARICRAYASPEQINEVRETCPSRRILKLFPAYNKPLHGPLVAERIGLEKIRAVCPHFADWMAQLEQYARQ
jgi:hypothetical protein